MKSTQIFPMFISLTEDQEVALCGGESNVVSYSSSYSSQVITDKKGTRKQIKKVVNTKTTKGKTSVPGLLKSLEIQLPSLLEEFDWE